MNQTTLPIFMRRGVLLPGATDNISSLECQKKAYKELNAFAQAFPELRNRGMKVQKDERYGLPIVVDAAGVEIWGCQYTHSQFNLLEGIDHACKTYGVKLGISNRRVIVRRLKLIGQFDK